LPTAGLCFILLKFPPPAAAVALFDVHFKRYGAQAFNGESAP
jgi:hypothetical protein